MLTFQDLIAKLTNYWKEQGCLLQQGYDLEVGAGTFNPNTFLRCLGPEPYNAVYIEPSRRPADGRYGENPNRLQQHHQCQVILKPSPDNLQELYLNSLRAIGLNLAEHDIRFVHDDWESPTLGAWGLGWEVWLDGMEVTQFTYFQCVGSVNLTPITGELTYGLERIAMYLQNVNNVYDLQWNEILTYGDIFLRNEIEWSQYNFEHANLEMWSRHFQDYENEAEKLIEQKLTIPAYDFVMKASHAFNLLEARGAISVTERTGYITRIRNLSRKIAEGYIANRSLLKHPLLEKFVPKKIETKNTTPKTLPILEKAEDFILEIGSEELPATFVDIGRENLGNDIKKMLESEGLEFESIQTYATPRRLTAYIKKLSHEKPAKKVKRRGPPLKAIYDKDNQLTKAGIGFFNSIKLTPPSLEQIKKEEIDNLEIREIKGTLYIFAIIIEKGHSAAEILSSKLKDLILNISFPKKMRWGLHSITYARPLRWLLAMHGSQVIPFSIDNIESSDITYGHSQLAPEALSIKLPAEYLATLKEHFVIADYHERTSTIAAQLEKLEKDNNFFALEKDNVLKQVVNLTEYPLLAVADFDEKFLEIPEEVITSEMIEHQKYFPLKDIQGKLINKFIITANNSISELIKEGNSKVLSARLADGEFLYRLDLKESLETFNEKLKQVTHQKDIGTMFEKVERIIDNTGILYEYLKVGSLAEAKRAALLCKADLATGLVCEFPGLQGTIGKYYALQQKETQVVSQAIEEHWMPRGENDSLPQSPEAVLVSIADKIDNLICCFSIGLTPTSSSDPYALRRQVLGIIKILINHKFNLPLAEVLQKSFENFRNNNPQKNLDEKCVEKIKTFILNRIKTVFKEYGLSVDEINAALTIDFNDIYDIYCRAKALDNFRKEDCESFNKLSEVYKRSKGQVNEESNLIIDPALLIQEEEKELFKKLSEVQSKVDEALEIKDYRDAYNNLVELQHSLALFWDNVRVLDDDPAIKKNRLAILSKLLHLFNKILDFSKIKNH